MLTDVCKRIVFASSDSLNVKLSTKKEYFSLQKTRQKYLWENQIMEQTYFNVNFCEDWICCDGHTGDKFNSLPIFRRK